MTKIKIEGGKNAKEARTKDGWSSKAGNIALNR
jgi:hypothetical protein